MSFSHLLDTSILSQPLKDRPIRSVQRRWTPERSRRFCTSSICQAELLRGLERRQSAKLWHRFDEYVLSEIEVLPFGSQEASVYGRICGRLSTEGTGRGFADL